MRRAATHLLAFTLGVAAGLLIDDCWPEPDPEPVPVDTVTKPIADDAPPTGGQQ